MEDLIDDAGSDEVFLMISDRREEFANLHHLWDIESNRGHEEGNHVVGNTPPVASPCQFYLVSVRGPDSPVALGGDGDGEEYAGRHHDVAQAISPGRYLHQN